MAGAEARRSPNARTARKSVANLLGVAFGAECAIEAFAGDADLASDLAYTACDDAERVGNKVGVFAFESVGDVGCNRIGANEIRGGIKGLGR